MSADISNIAHRKGRVANWAQVYRCFPRTIFLPTTVDEVQRIIRHARALGRGVRAVGACHSPSDIVCTADYVVSLERMTQLVTVDVERQIVTCQGGTWLYDLHPALRAHGLALPTLGSISAQTVAGSISTAIHGYGYNHGCFSSYVRHLVLVLGDGSVRRCSPTEDSDLFYASLCGLGATGIIVEASIQCEADYRLEQETFSMAIEQYIDAIVGPDGTTDTGLFASAEHVRAYWFPQIGKTNVQRANRTKRPRTRTAWWSRVLTRLLGYLHITGLFVGRYFPSYLQWHARLMWRFSECPGSLKTSPPPPTKLNPWQRISRTATEVDTPEAIFNYDCGPRQYTFECAVKLEDAVEAVRALQAWLEAEYADPHGMRHHFPIEMRVNAGDDIWLSPAYKRRVLWIGIMQYKPFNFCVPYKRLFRRFEHITLSHNGRPHWAKAHTASKTDLERMYDKLPAFLVVQKRVDPDGVFLNAYLRRHLLGEVGEKVDTNRWKWTTPYWKALSV